MRLRRLTLRRYGCFEEEAVVFDPAPGRLNLVLAPNGAGKSVLRQAFSDLICGIPVRSAMDFRFGYAGMRLLAEAVLPDGRVLAFGRRKGQGNTLTDGEGAPLDRAVLEAATGPVDRALLERLFALDTALLRRGGEGLLASGGSLADALVSAAGGLRQARGLLAALREGRDGLAPERRIASRPFHAALDQLGAARKALEEAVFTPQAWAREQEALAQARGRQEAANAASRAARLGIARLERLRRVRPLLAAHDAAQAWLADHPDAPVLPADLGARLVAARTALEAAEERVRATQVDLARLEAGRAALAPDPAILAEADAIAALAGQEGAAQKAALDLPGVEAGWREAAAEVARLEGELGIAGAVETAAPAPMALREARRVIGLHDRLAAERSRLPAQRAARRQEAEVARAALEALPPAEETAGLAALVREIQAGGDPGAREAAAAELARRRRAEADAALGGVPGWHGTAEALAALVVPAPEVLAALEALVAGAARGVALAAQARAQAEAALGVARRRLEGLGEARDLADPAAVAGARAHRDRGWDLVFRQAFGGTPPAAEEVRAWTGGAALPLAYAAAVAGADRVADRREALAARIAEAAVAGRAVVEAEAALAAAAAACAEAEAAERAASARREAVCVGLGLSPDAGIATLRSFPPARTAALAALREASLAEAVRAELAAVHEGWRVRLAAALGRDEGLGALLADAGVRLQRREEEVAERSGAVARLRQAELQLRQLDQVAAELDTQWEAFGLAWQASQAALGRDAAEAPELVREILDLYTGLAAARARRADLAGRIEGMRGDIARFRDAAAALHRRLDPAAPADAPPGVVGLRGRLDAARATAGRLAELERGMVLAREAAGRAAQALEAADAVLIAVVTAAGAGDAEAALARIALSVERGAQAARREEAVAALHDAGDGRSLGELRAEVAALPSDGAVVAMEQARQEEADAQAAAQEAASEAASIAARLAHLSTDLRAVSARADEEAALASLGRVLDEALVLHAASLLLERGLAGVEAAGTGPLLRRIGAHVAALTDGAYDLVTTEESTDGTAVLRLRQPGVPDEPKRMEQLSEGTRDQLFLALRLVAIEDHMRTVPAVPFIADDILQTFDDARASRALAALAGLSRQVQVIVLTHHPHVVELAAAAGLEVHLHRLAAA